MKLIVEFISLKSPQGARNVIRDLVLQRKNIHFVEQYQVGEFLGEPYRRMIVRDYKVIYKIHSETEIRILQSFDTLQNSAKLQR